MHNAKYLNKKELNPDSSIYTSFCSKRKHQITKKFSLLSQVVYRESSIWDFISIKKVKTIQKLIQIYFNILAT